MKIVLLFFFVGLTILDLSFANSNLETARFNDGLMRRLKSDTVAEMPKRKVFDFLALEETAQVNSTRPKSYRATFPEQKRSRLITFHLKENHMTQSSKNEEKRKNATYVRPTSYSYYKQGQNLKSNESPVRLGADGNSKYIIHVNRSSKAKVPQAAAENAEKGENKPIIALPIAEVSSSDNVQAGSELISETTENKNDNLQSTTIEGHLPFPLESNNTQHNDSWITALDTFQSSNIAEEPVSYFFKSSTATVPVVSSAAIPTENTTLNSASISSYASISYFPVAFNSTVPESSLREASENFTTNNFSHILSDGLTSIAGSNLSITDAPLVDTTSITPAINELIEEIPNHYLNAPISPARVASLLGFEKNTQSDISNIFGQSRGLFDLGGYGSYGGGLTGSDKSNSDLSLGFSNFGLNFGLLGSQPTNINVNQQQSPLFGGLALDYLRQLAIPQESDSSQLDLSQTLESIRGFTSSGGPLPLPIGNSGPTNFNDFLGLGSLSFLQGQQDPLKQLNSENLLSSLSYSPQFTSSNSVNPLSIPLSGTTTSLGSDQHSESDSKKGISAKVA